MPRFVVCFLLLISVLNPAFAQDRSLTLNGFTEQPIVLSEQVLRDYGVKEIKDSREISGAGAHKVEVVYQAVPLKVILLQNGYDRIERHRIRSSSILATASDNYTVSFSWGEIFNSTVGDGIFVILQESGGLSQDKSPQLSIRSFQDIRSGARHVKNLKSLNLRF